jgi:hypothetical protein
MNPGKSLLIENLVRIAVVVITLSLIVILFIDEGGGEFEAKQSKMRHINYVENLSYKQECGSCHLAYPAGLLPERSWIKMMNGLNDHFGENAELEQRAHAEILTYLVENSAERGSRRSTKIAASIDTIDLPLRFTETKFFRIKHRELTEDKFKHSNVLSRSNCQSCHPKADQAGFSVYEVKTPD